MNLEVRPSNSRQKHVNDAKELSNLLAAMPHLEKVHLPPPNCIYAPNNGLAGFIELRKFDFLVFSQIIAYQIAWTSPTLCCIAFDKHPDEEVEPSVRSRSLHVRHSKARFPKKFAWERLIAVDIANTEINAHGSKWSNGYKALTP
jgi:hypothetical protein